MAAKAKVFMTGRSQAVRLPKEFRLSVKEVSVRRVGSALVLEPEPQSLEEVFREIDAIKGSQLKRPKQPAPAKRLAIT